MYLILWVVFLVLSLILIVIGLFRPEHTEMALIGFVFLFLLSLNLEVGSIQFKTGEIYNYGCLCCGEYLDGERQELVFGAHNCTDSDNSTLVITSISDSYETFDTGGTMAHVVGYWLMVMSIIGFIGVIISLRAQRFN